MSRVLINSELLDPPGILPGHHIIHGSLILPSIIPLLYPEKGKLLPLLVAPLSDVKTTSVLLSISNSSRVLIICPVDQSSSSIASPYLPLFDFPAKSGLLKRGTWGMVCGR